MICAGLILGYVRRPAGAEYFREGLFKWFLFGIAISFHPRIDLAAHVGGAVVGALMGLLLATQDQARRLPGWLWLQGVPWSTPSTTKRKRFSLKKWRRTVKISIRISMR